MTARPKVVLCTADFVLGCFAEVVAGARIRRPQHIGKHSWSQAVRRLRAFGYLITYHRDDDSWSLDGLATGEATGLHLVRHTMTDAELDIIADLVAERLILRQKERQCTPRPTG